MDKGKSPPPPKGTQKATTPKTFQRPRGGEAKSVSSLMPDIGRAAFRKFGFVQSSVVSRWDEIVGARYAAVSAPEAIRFPIGKKSDGTLELTVEGAHATMIQHVLPEIIDRVMSKLSPNDREIINLRFYHDSSLEDISHTLSIKLSATKARLYRSIDRFKQLYTQLDGSQACVDTA